MAAILKERAIAKLRKEVMGKDGLPTMSLAAIKLACIEHDGYETPALNEKLFLHFKGFKYVENLESYTSLKTLFLESNGLAHISGLETCVNLRSLYLQQNGISVIEGLDSLVNLKTLNLSQNRILKVENLASLVQLETLNLGKNALSGDDAVEGILECPSITNLDLTSNDLEDPEILTNVLTKMPRLSCVYLKGNGLVRKTKHYRKTMITSLSRLAYLDDRPIFEIERVAAEAWKAGGKDAEREARQAFNQRKQDKDRQQRVEFKRWKAERRRVRAEEIAKAKAEGRELPKPKCFVRYTTVSKDEVERDEDERRRLHIAERRALNDAGNGMAGESTATIEEMGRQYAEDCGAKFDENGSLVEPGKTDDSPKGTKSYGDLGIVKKDHHFAEGYLEDEQEEEEKRQQKEMATAPAAPVAPVAALVPPTPPITAVTAAATTVEEIIEVADPLDKDRRKAVQDSVRLYRERSKANKSNKAGDSMDLTASSSRTTMSQQEDPMSRDMDAMNVLNMEYKSMTPSQRTQLDERVQEAEEEEENYRSERAKMKAKGSSNVVRRVVAQNNVGGQEEEEEETDEIDTTSGGWTKERDDRVQELTRQHLFDFEAVANDMGNEVDKDACRLRFALLSSNGGVAPPITATQKKKTQMKTSVVAKSSAPAAARPQQSRAYRGQPTRSTASAPTSSYTPWSGASTLGGSSAGIEAPPPAANDSVFNSKVMRIKPVSVDLDALPSMLSDDDDSEEDDDDDTMTTDVDAMD